MYICVNLIRHLFLSPRSVFSANPSFAVSVLMLKHVWELKQIKDLYMRTVAPRNLFIVTSQILALPVEGSFAILHSTLAMIAVRFFALTASLSSLDSI